MHRASQGIRILPVAIFAVALSLVLTPVVRAQSEFDGAWSGIWIDPGSQYCSGKYNIEIVVTGGHVTGKIIGPRASCKILGDIDDQGTAFLAGACGTRATFLLYTTFTGSKATGNLTVDVNSGADVCKGEVTVNRNKN